MDERKEAADDAAHDGGHPLSDVDREVVRIWVPARPEGRAGVPHRPRYACHRCDVESNEPACWICGGSCEINRSLYLPRHNE